VRILAVLPFVPYPPTQGDRLRAWEMLTALAAVGDLTVRIIAPVVSRAPRCRVLEGLPANVEFYPLTRANVLGGAVVGLLSGRPPGITAYWRGPRRTKTEPGATPWDLAVGFQFRSAPYVLAESAGLRVLELTDALGLYRKQLPWRGRAALQRALLRGVEGLERDLPGQFNHVWVSACDDADWIERLSKRKVQVIPNGCNPVPAPAPYQSDGPILFVGNMRYPPNEDGILWFSRHVWPLFFNQYPHRRLRVVGTPTRKVQGLSREPGIEVAGFVPRVVEEFAAAAVVINPVRYGSGTNRKVLDAWATARPVVSTPVGIRGFPCDPDRDILVANSSSEWHTQLSNLCANESLGAKLGERGWLLARQRFVARHIWANALEMISIRSQDS